MGWASRALANGSNSLSTGTAVTPGVPGSIALSGARQLPLGFKSMGLHGAIGPDGQGYAYSADGRTLTPMELHTSDGQVVPLTAQAINSGLKGDIYDPATGNRLGNTDSWKQNLAKSAALFGAIVAGGYGATALAGGAGASGAGAGAGATSGSAYGGLPIAATGSTAGIPGTSVALGATGAGTTAAGAAGAGTAATTGGFSLGSLTPSLISAGESLAGKYFQDRAGNKAVAAQQAATDQARAANAQALAEQRALLGPYTGAGTAALSNLSALVGGAPFTPPPGSMPTGPTLTQGQGMRNVTQGTPTGITAVPRDPNAMIRLADGSIVPASSLAALNRSSVRTA